MVNIHFASSTQKWQPSVGLDNIELAVIGVEAYGENINLCNIINCIKKRTKKLIGIMPDALYRLIKEANLFDECYPFTHDKVIKAQYAVDILELSGNVPLEIDRKPYLHPIEADVSLWQKRMQPLQKKRIGIAWQGAKIRKGDDVRSSSLLDFLPIIQQYGEHDFISLQKQHGAEQYQIDPAILYNPMPYVNDFADSAALISQCDLVISTDTALPHLSAAIGQKTMLLLPEKGTDWRWQHDEVSWPHHATIWYEAMRVWRQIPCETWAQTIKRTVPLMLENYL